MTNPYGAKLVEIYRSAYIDSEAMREVLEGSGRPATLDNHGGSGFYPVNVGTMGEAGLYVREEDAERALAILEAARAGEFALDENQWEPDERSEEADDDPSTG